MSPRTLLLAAALSVAASVSPVLAAHSPTRDPRGALARSPDQGRGNNTGWNAVVWLPAARVQAMLPRGMSLVPQRDPSGATSALHPVLVDVSHVSGGRLVLGGEDSRVVTRRAYGAAGALWGMWGGPLGMMWGNAVGRAYGAAAHAVGEQVFGDCNEAMILVPQVTGPHQHGTYTFVHGMKVDATLPRNLDAERGFGFGKEMVRFTGSGLIAAPDGARMLSATTSGATARTSVADASPSDRRRLQLGFADPFVGVLRDGSGLVGVSRVTRNPTIGRYAPARASLTLTDRLGQGLGGQHEATDALHFEGLETTASAPVHARVDDL